MEAKCCENAMNVTAEHIRDFIKTVLPSMDLRSRNRLIIGLSKIHPAFIDIMKTESGVPFE